jgi:alkylation response protein AidB-like acyl-CoA dehydrogenase
MTADPTSEIEPVENFALRARMWLKDNMPPARPSGPGTYRDHSDDEQLTRVTRCRQLQRLLFDGGLAGVAVPTEYGGQGLTQAHQDALNHEIVGYDYPAEIQSATFTPCLPVILEFGTEEQKRRFVPPILRGETLWMQFLSEPSGGSDAAGAQTTAIPDGDEWVVNGSKIWTTGAWWADWALLLARTNWDVEKHRGLTVFALPIHQPNIEIHRIEMLNGSKEFCQEFLTDVRIPDTDRIGEIDQGWTVGVRWMYHERTVTGGAQYAIQPASQPRGPASGASALIDDLRRSGQPIGDKTRQLIGEMRALELIGPALTRRIATGIRTGRTTDQAAAITRLFIGTSSVRRSTIAFELAGTGSIAWTSTDDAATSPGTAYLMRQVACIGGGTTEMSRNVISERVLGMPRERSGDRDIPFRDVPRSNPNR